MCTIGGMSIIVLNGFVFQGFSFIMEIHLFVLRANQRKLSLIVYQNRIMLLFGPYLTASSITLNIKGNDDSSKTARLSMNKHLEELT